MKKFVAILLLFLLCAQAIPVVPLLVGDDVTCTWVDEDKPDDGKIKEKKAGKEICELQVPAIIAEATDIDWADPVLGKLPIPHLDKTTPPPNGNC